MVLTLADHGVQYNVTPRYTPGGPGRVSRDQAYAIAGQELHAHQDLLEGFAGEDRKRHAAELGLSGIVERWEELWNGWRIHDLITGERAFWPFETTCLWCGRKKIPCRRGTLREHKNKRRTGCSGSGRYVGEELELGEPLFGPE